MTGWTFDPLVVALLAGAAGVFVRGLRRMRRRPGAGRVLAAAGAVMAIALALLSPIEPLAERSLWAHMVQHLLLIMGAAPLLAVAAPGIPLLVGLPRPLRHATQDARSAAPARAARGLLARPLVVWVLATGVLWAWHAPALYATALESPSLHALEHATLLGTAWLFWWTALRRSGALRPGADIVFLVTGGLQAGALGALLSFATEPIYAPYAPAASAGLGALQDQQLAGAIMWIPTGVVTLLIACALFVRWVAAESGASPPSPHRPAETSAR